MRGSDNRRGPVVFRGWGARQRPRRRRWFALVALAVTAGGVGGVADGCGRDTGPPATGLQAPQERPWFVDHTTRSGIDFVYDSGASGKRDLPEIMGAGVALLDYDDDGDLDVYLVNGEGSNRLYRNEASGRFVDVTQASGLGDGGFGMGVATGDVDNDGHLDVFVTNYGPDRLYRNNGDGTFTDITAEAGIDVPGWSCSAAFVDYDRDGFLDLYVTQYVIFDADRKCVNHAGEPIYCGPKSFTPAPDVLLRNEGHSTLPRFMDVSAQAGIAAVSCAGLGVVCEDFNDDGWPDIYVANDAYANQLWINGRDGTFTDVAVELGAAYNLHGQPEAGMGVVAADLSGRGRFDVFVTHLQGETNTLYLAEPDGGFTDATGRSGLGPPSKALTGFGTSALDADLDGDLDLVVVNGRVRRGPVLAKTELAPPWDLLAEPNQFYENLGQGRFTLGGMEVAPLAMTVEISRGLAAGDVDGDGDLDLLVGNVEGPARLYVNEMPRRGRWLIVRAIDPRLRRDAIGAQLRVLVGEGTRTLTRTVRSSDGYCSSQDPRVHFGLGEVERVESVLVRWPDGRREWFDVGCVDCSIEVQRGQGEVLP